MLGLLRRSPDFRRLFLAHSVSRAGDAFNTVALVVLVFGLTGSGAGVATTVAFEVLPVLLLGPAAGLVADRHPRRRVMVAADLIRAALALALAAAHGSFVLAVAVAFGLAAGSVLFNPAASSLVPEVVADDEVVTANAALWTVAVVAQIVLAPFAGWLIATVGVGWAFAVNAASFVVSAGFVARLDAGRRPASIRGRGWSGVGEGVRVVRADPLLGRLVVVQVLAALSAGATSGLLVVLASDSLGVGPSGFGALLGAIGVGAAAGPLLLRRFVRPAHAGWLFGPYALRGGVDLVLAATPVPLVAGAALAAYGVGTSTGMIAYQSTVQTLVPDQARARAFVVFDVTWNSARLVSLGAGGLLADAVGVRAVYVAGAALLLAAAAVGLAGPVRGVAAPSVEAAGPPARPPRPGGPAPPGPPGDRGRT